MQSTYSKIFRKRHARPVYHRCYFWFVCFFFSFSVCYRFSFLSFPSFLTLCTRCVFFLQIKPCICMHSHTHTCIFMHDIWNWKLMADFVPPNSYDLFIYFRLTDLKKKKQNQLTQMRWEIAIVYYLVEICWPQQLHAFIYTSLMYLILFFLRYFHSNVFKWIK